MKSLAERHADRAQRKADNEQESTASEIKGRLANASWLMEEAQVAFAGLTDDEKSRLRDAYDGADAVDGFKSIAEDDAGNFKYAGIGIVNPLVVPPADQPAPVNLSEVTARAGNGGGSDGTNLAGAAVDDAIAAAGWGTPAEPEAPAEPVGNEGQPKVPAEPETPATSAKSAKAATSK